MEHRLLTGDSLHEPKGVETATNGQVYVSNGLGTGVWTDRLSGIYNLNSFVMSGFIPDVSSVTSFFCVAPVKGTLNKFYGTLSGPITTANDTLTIYKNGIAQTPTVIVNFTGSGAGVVTSATLNISVNEGDVIEVRSDGASDTAALMSVGLRFTAVA